MKKSILITLLAFMALFTQAQTNRYLKMSDTLQVTPPRIVTKYQLEQAVRLKANENEVLHKIGNEIKTGNLQLNGNLNSDGNISSTDGEIRSYRYSNGVGISIVPEFIKFKTDAANLRFEGRLQAPNISDNRDWYLPDTSGIIAVGNFIKANPATPQNAGIEITGGINSGYLNTGETSVTGNLYLNGTKKLYPRGGTGVYTWSIGYNETTDELDMLTGNAFAKFSGGIKIATTPGSATSDFTILVRDNTSGEVRKVELADLKSMLNALN